MTVAQFTFFRTERCYKIVLYKIHIKYYTDKSDTVLSMNPVYQNKSLRPEFFQTSSIIVKK